MATNLENIFIASVLMAFILPVMVSVSQTLPVPTTSSGQNISANFTQTGVYINGHLGATFKGLTQTLVGTGCVGNGTIAAHCNTSGGSFSANPTITSAFAFIVSNLGTIMLDIVQLPYLDFVSMNTLIQGFSSVLPVGSIAFVKAGAYLLYIYLAFTMLMTGFSAIQKYDVMQT